MQTNPHELGHTTIATWALAIERALLAAGVDPLPLFAAAGIPHDIISDAEQRIPVANMWKLWRAAVEKTANDAFGLEAAEYMFPTYLNALLFAMQASASLRECVGRLQRYAKGVTTIAEIQVTEQNTEQGRELWISLDSDNSGSDQRPHQPIDAFVAVLSRLLADLLRQGKEGALRGIHLQRPEPENIQRFREFFDCPLQFSQSDNLLMLDAALLDQPLPSANSTIALMNDQLLNEYLSRLNNESVSLRVRKEIMALLGTDQLTQDAVAERLNMSSRNLHRKLADEGASFKELLDVIRKDLALRYLGVSDMSLNEVTYTLGFIDQSSFSRAFKRWTGQTPGQYRKEHKK